jgi:hypothetical protein
VHARLGCVALEGLNSQNSPEPIVAGALLRHSPAPWTGALLDVVGFLRGLAEIWSLVASGPGGRPRQISGRKMAALVLPPRPATGSGPISGRRG